MKRIAPISVFLLALAGAPLVPMANHQAIAAEGTPAEAPHVGEGGVPMFERDMSWPQLPPAWTVGASVSWVSPDAQDNIWIITRPKDLAERNPGAAKTAIPPAVIEFDQQGKFLQGWTGKDGSGYAWPANEHSISVDSKGFLWIIGSNQNPTNEPKKLANDSQILKYTTAGKFLMAIGKPNLVGSNKTDVIRGASDSFYVAKTNELFVSDGYGNSRVIVYDADTGKMKRMWGAYGKTPLDKEDRPPAPKEARSVFPMLAHTLQQFETAHGIRVSDDGLVYLADRNNKRLQVFTTDGKFVTEKFLGLDSEFPLQARSVAFSPDQRFLYVGGTPVIYILNRKTLEVLGTIHTGIGTPGHPPGHSVGTDHHGNLYVTQADPTGLDGTSKTTFGVYRWKFTGYSPATK